MISRTQSFYNNRTIPLSSLDETERLRALHRYHIVDTKPEVTFDRITALVAETFHVPFAKLMFIDQDRVWVKSSYGGMNLQEVKRSHSLCSYILTLRQPVQIPESLLHLQFANPARVTGLWNIRFCASAPISTSDGYNIGALSIFDTNPRQLTAEELDILSQFTAVVSDFLELRQQSLLNHSSSSSLSPFPSSEKTVSSFLPDLQEGAFLSVEELSQYYAHGKRDFTGINLSGQNFGGVILENVNLSRAHLNGANFSGARLNQVNLNGASLRGASLRGCDLSHANLSFADLRGADFSGSDLRYADLTFVLLNETKLTGTILIGATMPDGSVYE